MLDVAIIGGGLSGLSLAQRLQSENLTFAVFEARERFGGRILSLSSPHHNSIVDPFFRSDLGPSWIWPDEQPLMADFIREHGLETFPQWQEGMFLYQTDRQLPAQSFDDPATYASARRIVGGSYHLIETLLARMPTAFLYLNHRLQTLTDLGDHVELQFNYPSKSFTVKARRVVLTIPPRLLVESVSFDPPLASRLHRLMRDTSTWMAGHAKAVIYYSQAFWRKAHYSGSVLASYRGAALAEIFDACSACGERAALAGFFALPAVLRSRYRTDLETLIVEQLVRLFGRAAACPEAIVIQDWFTESCTATSADEVPPSSHPQYGHPWLQLDHWNDKLFFSGTETSAHYGGYLEGALASAERVAKALLLSDSCHLNLSKTL
ncbi:MAG: flavin monoamine oxidase family protein [Gammaproteobacteria bacterium]